jgi:hypothetical protein
MHEAPRRDGSVAIYGDEDSLIVVEPIILGIAPVRGCAFCACGAPLTPWGWRHITTDHVEILCTVCHRALAFIRLGARAHV